MSDVGVAWITGASRGLGRAIALDLARDGWTIGVGFRRETAGAEETVLAIQRLGGRAVALRADLSDWRHAQRSCADLLQRFGQLDALINAAGSFSRGSALECTPDQWSDAFADNLHAVLFACRPAAAHMIARKAGRIINFGVANADRLAANPGVTAHYLAKLGVLALSRSLAKEMAPHGITVNCVSPGFIRHPQSPPHAFGRAAAQIPMGQAGSPSDVIAAVRYLLSPGANYVTGTNIVVSGGWGI